MEIWYLRGQAHAHLGMTKDAMDDLHRVLKSDSGHARAKILLQKIKSSFGVKHADREKAVTIPRAAAANADGKDDDDLVAISGISLMRK